MSSGSYYPISVKGVEIPKKNGKKRFLGIPTIEDRVAQMVLRNRLEPMFHEDPMAIELINQHWMQ